MYRMMIVDDSNIIRNKIARNLHNFEVIAKAKNGIEAVKLAKHYHPEVVTMDLTMPEMDGLQCIKALVAEDPEVRILVVSALSDKATGIRALTLGASGFLCKPFTDEELQEALDELME